MKKILLIGLWTMFTQVIIAQILFTDNSNRLVFPNVKSGAPIGVVDINNDGRDDIVQLDGTTHLYIQYQNEDTTFTGFDGGETGGSQWSLCVADVDNNGFNDIFTGGAYNGLKLYRATSTGTDFVLTTLTGSIFLQGSNFVDINTDGSIDIFACHDEGLSAPYRNNGLGTFSLDYDLINPVSTVPSDNSGNYGSVWTDYDNDGDLDLYLSKCRQGVTNPMDGRRLNQLFQNDGNNNFTDVAAQANLLPMAQSWATDFADIDNDGDMDAFIINHDTGSVLMENQGNGTFFDITSSSGMEPGITMAGFGIQVKFEDFDNDGFVDMLFTTLSNTGHALFHNNGDKTFTQVTLGLSPFDRIHSAATGDLNSDGFIDVYASYGFSFNGVGNIADRLYLNAGNDNNYFKINLKGQFSNRNGIGARVELYGEWGKQIREVRSGESYGITTSFISHFGLGSATSIDSVIVKWPSGTIDKVEAPDINQQLLLEEGEFCQNTVDFDFTMGSLTVDFTDESSVMSDQWLWTFGNGISSSEQNPTHTYQDIGTYEVCLTIGGTCMTCKQVTVNCPLPDASFATEVDDLTVQFQDQTAFEPTSWLWSFGNDGDISMEQNPSFTFSQEGTYEVCMIASNSCGNTQFCEMITVSCFSEASFTATFDDLEAVFIATADSNTTAYSWDFGDGITSDLQSPEHLYTVPGEYLVCLTISNNCGSREICETYMVNCPAPQVGYTYEVDTLTVNFLNNSEEDIMNWLWEFGDGNTSTEPSPSHIYSQDGTYEVCLTATNICGSTQTCVEVALNCNVPEAGFNSTTDQLVLTIENTSAFEPNSYAWNFGDGNTSTEINPTHSFAQEGTYEVCLIASNGCGSSEYCSMVTVSCPTTSALFGFEIDALSLVLSDSSSGTPDNWEWTFGDGTTSSEQNPNHTFEQPGTYEICLTVENDCSINTSCEMLSFSCAAPMAAFNFTAEDQFVNFEDLSTVEPSTWFWTFGDGTNSTEASPEHIYTNSGTYEVCLIASSVCGSDTTCQAISIICNPIPPEFEYDIDDLTVSFTNLMDFPGNTYGWSYGDGGFSPDASPTYTFPEAGIYEVCLTVVNGCGGVTSCESILVGCSTPEAAFLATVNELDIAFIDTSGIEAEEWLWTFGDGDSSTVQNPMHSYTMPGTYEVCLTTTNNCGADILCQTYELSCAAPIADFSYSSEELLSNFVDLSANNPTEWLWTFSNGDVSTERNPQYTFATPGLYEVCLISSSICGSSDTICQSIEVFCTPTAPPMFEVDADELSLSFTDMSPDMPIEWLWTFGDSTISTEQNPMHAYIFPGIYEVCLTTTTICGESPVICQTITVSCSAPQALFEFEADELALSFQDLTTNNPIEWSWSFGDGSASNLPSPEYTYDMPGTYEVCLEVSSICGTTFRCEEIEVLCAAPVASFTDTLDGLTHTFFDTSEEEPEAWLWTFGDGDSSSVQNPVHTFDLPGAYEVCLEVSNICGVSTVCQTIVASCDAPVASFSAIQSELVASFLNQSSMDAEEWLWTFGDGTSSAEENPEHEYELPGTYEVCLTVTNLCGSSILCSLVEVNCSAPNAKFEYEPEGLVVNFIDISAPTPDEWLWDFGGGTFSIAQNPVHTFPEAGMYNVCLIATTLCGSDTICQDINLIIDATSDLEEGQEIQLYPNPAKHFIDLELVNIPAGLIELSIFSVSGQQVATKQRMEGILERKRLNIEALTPGVYFLRIQTGDINVVRRFIKQ